MKKTFKIEIKADNCEIVFAEGLDKGVLGYVELSYDLPEKEYKSSLFAAHLLEKAEEYRDELVNIEMKEINGQ